MDSGLSERYGLWPGFVFGFAALSCIALSYRLGQATESLGARLGPIAGGLLNATFGNAAELIISIVALHQGLFIVVRTSLIGSILGQLLLVLGTSLLVAGLMYRNLSFSRTLIQINFTVMVIAAVAIGLPSILLVIVPENALTGAGVLTPVLSTLLIIIYALAVVFALRRQPQEEENTGSARWALPTALLVLAGFHRRHRLHIRIPGRKHSPLSRVNWHF